MHPSEPPETAPQPSPTVPAQPQSPPEKPRNRRLRLWLALTAGILTLLCLGTAGVVISLYDDATKIDRSEPDVVTDSFLIGFMQDRDDEQASLFTCDNADLAALTALRAELVQREKDKNVTVTVSWGALTRTPAGQGAENVDVTMTISGFADGQMLSSRDEDWRFTVRSEDEKWRVCSAAKVA